ncbi:hypothetical protein GOBAR_AA13455 [Gossypium barbadense]|uniref:Uncharacterized protein n=1 Tax=Gossypium barbadense TaxID=3634 RepID=A0A2P5XV22_GOSBA|nr:hypothetical protein GOBAR_AA13455 [Gossypium barbadense]
MHSRLYRSQLGIVKQLWKKKGQIPELVAVEEQGIILPVKVVSWGDSFRARGNFGSGRGGYGRHEIRHPGDFLGQPKGSGGWNGDNNPKGVNRVEGVAIKGGQKQHDSTWE